MEKCYSRDNWLRRHISLETHRVLETYCLDDILGCGDMLLTNHHILEKLQAKSRAGNRYNSGNYQRLWTHGTRDT